MAGSFGFEAAKYDLSMQIGERKLLPAVRAADPGALIIADGFSCRTQIEQATGRRPLHLAQVIQQAMRRQRGQIPVPALAPERHHSLMPMAAVAIAVLVGVSAVWRARRRR